MFYVNLSRIAGCGIAIALVVTFLVFPHTMNYEFVRSLSKTLDQVEHIVAFQHTVLRVDVDVKSQSPRKGSSSAHVDSDDGVGSEKLRARPSENELKEAGKFAEAWKLLETEVTAKRQAITSGVTALDGKSAFLDLEGQ